jgi:4-amino-4-deoxy-L-arabinose transferase-like glycosyltransferase
MMQNKLRLTLAAGLLLSVLSLLGVVLLPISMLRLAATMLLVCFLPGWALVEGLFAPSRERPSLAERLVLGMGFSYIVTIVGGLWLYYALGRLTLVSFLGLYVVVSIIGFGLAISRRSSLPTPGYARGLAMAGSWWLLGLLAFAAYFRFYFLSYSDFRGDEAEVVLRAVAVIRGQGEPILSHTKGPAETLVATGVGLLYGALGELPVRLPFALANWLAVVGTYLLGARLFGRRIALIATALVAINGWLVTYGRTAQYQNLVLPLSILAVWCCVRFYQSGARVYHLMGILFLSAATFGHYEGASAAPAVLYLLILGLKQAERLNWPALASVRRWQPSKEIWIAGLSLLLGAAVVLSFYAPFILNPTVAGAQGHVAKRFGSSPPYNNWDDFYVNGLFYNAIYYVLGLGGLLLAGTLRGIRLALADTRLGTLAAVGALPVLLLSWTGLLSPWYAFLVYLGLMGLFLLSPRVSVSVKILLLWMALPSGLYLFAVERPGNHYYVFMPPLMLLAALAVDRGLSWLEQVRQLVGRWALPAVGGVLIVLYGLSAWYEHLVFMRTDLEYMLTYPQHRNSVFWSDPRYPFDIRIGWGFPYRLGWQTISELYRRGQLAGDWYGTDDNNSIYWYTLGWPRNPCYPRYFILADIGYSVPPLEVPMETIERSYALRTIVQVNGQPRLRLYEFAPLGSGTAPVLYEEPAGYPTPYRQEMLLSGQLDASALRPSVLPGPSRRFKLHPDTLQRLADAYGDSRILQVQDAVALLGYDIDNTWAVPGGVVLVTLHWQAETGLIFPYKVFAHLEDRRLWAQADGEPGCGQFPTHRWRAGDQVLDRHAIFLPEDLPPGDYSVQVGLYEIRTGLRMDLLDESGNPAGNTLALLPVTVRPGE